MFPLEANGTDTADWRFAASVPRWYAASRSADEFLDELAESRDGRVDVSVDVSSGYASPQCGRITGGCCHDADKFRWRLCQPDAAKLREPQAEVHLVVIDVLA